MTAAAFGSQIGVLPSGAVLTSDTRPFMLGFQFSVSTSLQVDGLAFFDAGNDGLVDSHQVGIWTNTGTLLVSATVPSGTGATLLNGFRVVPVSFLLSAGTYVVAGQRLTDNDPFEFRGTSSVNAPGVTYLGERELNTTSFVMPTSGPFNDIGDLRGNFTVVAAAVPEPGSLALVGAAGLLLGLVRRRRH